jgi:hypothetical protein
MHFSIAPVEITSHMSEQFAYTTHTRPAPRRGGMRRRVSVALHGLASRLDPQPATR